MLYDNLAASSSACPHTPRPTTYAPNHPNPHQAQHQHRPRAQHLRHTQLLRHIGTQRKQLRPRQHRQERKVCRVDRREEGPQPVNLGDIRGDDGRDVRRRGREGSELQRPVVLGREGRDVSVEGAEYARHGDGGRKQEGISRRSRV